MLPPQKLEQLARQLAESLPPGIKAGADEFELKARTVLQSQLMKLDLVSREEFDRQTAVLAKTRAMVEQLEARLNSLENSDEQ